MSARRVFVALASVLLLSGATAASASDLSSSVGYLRCDVKGGTGFIFGMTRDLTCTYEPSGKRPIQHYTGSIERYGIDIGFLKDSVMLWAVVTAGEDVPPGGLVGQYAGLSADVAAGLGVGINALVLGDHSVALQPLSIEGGTGLNIALGVAQLNLKAVK